MAASYLTNVKGKTKNLGSTFNTPQEAHEAYKKATNEMYGMYAKHG